MYSLPKSCLTIQFIAIQTGKEKTFFKQLLTTSEVLIGFH